jgi:hypothetical protein
VGNTLEFAALFAFGNVTATPDTNDDVSADGVLFIRAHTINMINITIMPNMSPYFTSIYVVRVIIFPKDCRFARGCRDALFANIPAAEIEYNAANI